MTNAELEAKRRQLRDKTESVAALHPMMAATQIKTAALLAAEITDELARRELARARDCPELGPGCRGCPDCQGIPFDEATDSALRQEVGQ